MKLTEDDYEALASQIEEGEDYAILDKDGEELEVHYQCEEDAYQEDDYYNGTGAWVVTAINVRILNVSCTNEDGEQVDVDLDECKLYQEVKAQKVI